MPSNADSGSGFARDIGSDGEKSLSSAASSSGAVRFAPCPWPSSTRSRRSGWRRRAHPRTARPSPGSRFRRAAAPAPRARRGDGSKRCASSARSSRGSVGTIRRRASHSGVPREQVDRLVVVARDLPQELARDGVAARPPRSGSPSARSLAGGEPAAHGGLVEREPRQVQLGAPRRPPRARRTNGRTASRRCPRPGRRPPRRGTRARARTRRRRWSRRGRAGRSRSP